MSITILQARTTSPVRVCTSTDSAGRPRLFLKWCSGPGRKTGRAGKSSLGATRRLGGSHQAPHTARSCATRHHGSDPRFPGSVACSRGRDAERRLHLIDTCLAPHVEGGRQFATAAANASLDLVNNHLVYGAKPHAHSMKRFQLYLALRLGIDGAVQDCGHIEMRQKEIRIGASHHDDGKIRVSL